MSEFTGIAKVYDREEYAFEAVSKGKVDEGDVVVIRYEGPKRRSRYERNAFNYSCTCRSRTWKKSCNGN